LGVVDDDPVFDVPTEAASNRASPNSRVGPLRRLAAVVVFVPCGLDDGFVLDFGGGFGLAGVRATVGVGDSGSSWIGGGER